MTISWPRQPETQRYSGGSAERSSSDGLQLVALDFPSGLQRARLSALDEHTIHLWRGEPPSGLRIEDAPLAQFVGQLSGEERARMLRFHFASDQSAFAFARGMLRLLLGGYLGVSPERLSFHHHELGKPALSAEWAKSNVHFNVSHTQGAVAIAICLGREIGTDIEYVREDFEAEEIASKFFSLSEQELLRSFAPGRARVEAFFRCWTRKEAWLKARGSGLAHPLKDFDVSLAANEREVTLVTRPDPDEALHWRILDAEAPPGYTAAVAIARH